jgi:hypothetical protein
LLFGTLAAPLWVVVVVVQGLTRDGFDFSRHPASLLSNGDQGWIQIINFFIMGLSVIAASQGYRRALSHGLGSTWVPRLVALFGIGALASGFFVLDPGQGFPPGAPAGAGELTWHGIAHLAASNVGFVALIGASVALARRFRSEGQSRWAALSLMLGCVFLVAIIIGMMVGATHQRAGTVVFGVGLLAAYTWFTLISHHLRLSVTD